MCELETRGATGHQPWSKPSNHANFCHPIQSGEFNHSQRACNNSKWIEAIKKEVDMLEKHACLQQVPEERNDIRPGNNNPSFKPKTTGSIKARPATIPIHPITDTTKVAKGDTPRDERNKVTCLFGSKQHVLIATIPVSTH
jgi:hypothetical protein